MRKGKAAYNDKIPLSFVERLCPSCAQQMRVKGFTNLRLSWVQHQITANAGNPPGISDKMIAGLCNHVGQDPGFFTTCMETDFGDFEPESKEGFCAWLHHVCEGRWPAEDKPDKGTQNMTINMIVKEDGKWFVKSKDGEKNLGGPYDSEEAAKKRLQEIEYFKHNALQTINAKFTPKVRHDKMEGRDYLVVPMVMLTEGVHAGSNGPLYYSPEELGKTPVVWNHKPIVVYHPTMDGQAISACDPSVIDARKVGVIMSATFDDGKLRAEAWLEPGRLRAVDNRVLESIEAGKPMEISTGLFTDNDDTPGTWKGEDYKQVAKNFRPDHLAILPDQKGACSLADGAGLLRNQAGEDLSLAQRALARALKIVQNELSQGEVSTKLCALLAEENKGKEGVGLSIPLWPMDVYDTWFTYQDGAKVYARDYKKEGDNVVLTGMPREVVRVTSYKTIDGKVVGNQARRNQMDKEKFVDDLIANEASPWDEGDREFLVKMDEGRLQKLTPVVNQPPVFKPKDLTPAETKEWDSLDEEGRIQFLKDRKAPVKNDEPVVEPIVEDEPLTVDEYIQKAPEEIREVLDNSLALHRAQKEKLISTITANKANQFPREVLVGKGLKELQAIAALAAPKKLAANYGGMGDAGNDQRTSSEEPLVAPVLNFGSDE